MQSSTTDVDGKTNRIVGLMSLAVGVGSGLVLGLWSFDGPVAVPQWLGDYTDTSRRLARLGHIAFLGLGILNILLVGEFARLPLARRTKRIALASMNFGNILLPLTLFAAAAYHPLKYTMPIPAVAVLVALVIAAYGAFEPGKESDVDS